MPRVDNLPMMWAPEKKVLIYDKLEDLRADAVAELTISADSANGEMFVRIRAHNLREAAQFASVRLHAAHRRHIWQIKGRTGEGRTR